MTSLRVVNLLKNDGLVRAANVSQSIPSSALRANEVHAEIVNVRRSLFGRELTVATDACPHAGELTPSVLQLPHVGQTLTQRRAIHKYVETQGAIYHAERQPEPVQMCAVVEDAPVAPWIVWTLRVATALTLTFISYELATVLPVIWGAK